MLLHAAASHSGSSYQRLVNWWSLAATDVRLLFAAPSHPVCIHEQPSTRGSLT
jgi:hypothetical protein